MLRRRLLAEFTGSAMLVTVVVGSGIAAAQLSPGDVGLQLLENSTATALGLAVLILLLGPVSGAHFNPVVSLVDWWLGRRSHTGISGPNLLAYSMVQVAGGIVGAVLANVMFDRRVIELATKDRVTTGHLVGEVVATAGLIALIFGLARTGRAALSAAAVGAYIGAAYWFTSSTSFANPACHDWPNVLRHVRRYRAQLGTAVHRRPACRRCSRCGRCARPVSRCRQNRRRRRRTPPHESHGVT